MTWTDERRRQQSESLKRYWASLTPEQRAARGAVQSEANRRYIASTTVEERAVRFNKPRSEAARANMREGWRRRGPVTTEAKQHISEGLRHYWTTLTPEQREARTRAWARAGRSTALLLKGSSLETTVGAALEDFGVAAVARKPLGVYCADFFVADRRLVIECDGAYWHERPERREYDARRDGWMQAHGYEVYRLPESVIQDEDSLTLALAEYFR